MWFAFGVISILLLFYTLFFSWSRLQNHGKFFPSTNPQHYVINLDRRTDRLERFVEQLEKASIHRWTRISATDGEIPRDYLKKYFKSTYYENEKHLGHVRCASSHIRTLEAIIAAGEKTPSVIWEDDAVIVPKFNKRLDEVLQALYKDQAPWDILYLGTTCAYHDYQRCHENDDDAKHIKPLYAPIHYGIGLWGYVVRNAVVAQTILDHCVGAIGWHFDHWLASNSVKEGIIKAYVCLPHLGFHPGQFEISSFNYKANTPFNYIYQSDTNI